MGRQVRMVPKDWQHPKDAKGDWVPLLERFTYNDEEIAEGLRDGWLSGEPPHYGIPVMPEFAEGTATHCMMYENTSEGTPISPAFATPEELARWLTDNDVSAFGPLKADEGWLRVCRGGWAPSLVIDGSGMRSGVAGLRGQKAEGC